MGTTARVAKRPNCDICGAPAHYDAKTKHGPWAYLCVEHFASMAASHELGTGRGQRLVVAE